MAYGTPIYNYESARSGLTQNKGLEDVARNYGRFMSQERFRRAGEDQTLGFKRQLPRVGSRFNRRGMYNSGLRRQGQQEFANDFQRQQARLQYDQGAEATQADMAQAAADARYQQELLRLYEEQQYARTAGYDPLAAVR